MSEETSYADRDGMQVRDLIKTHSILMHSEADMAARKVRHALQNYMSQVDQILGEQDGGRAPRDFRKTEIIDDQIDLAEKYPQCPECGSTGCENVVKEGPSHGCPGIPAEEKAPDE